MRVLWLAGNSALYKCADNQHGGYVGALQREILKDRSDISLAIAFPWRDDMIEKHREVSYYGVRLIRHPIINYKKKLKNQLQRLLSIINDFCPNIIHVFGTEMAFGLISSYTPVPVIIHIQGVLGAVYESWLPQNLSWKDYILSNPKEYFGYNALQKFVPREKEIFSRCHYFMGRTEWDKKISQLLSPKSMYFHCDEMMRPEIYNAEPWYYSPAQPFTIVSIASDALYKGTDVILRVANLLKQYCSDTYEWKVFGVDSLKRAEKLTGIDAEKVHVTAMGRAALSYIIDQFQKAHLYVHPSYIENSSNAICEAQCIGLPVIVTNVGGTASLVEDGVTGVLVPANDIYMMSSQIIEAIHNPIRFCKMGERAREVALKRHSPKAIVNQLVETYHSVKGVDQKTTIR